jgi:hypothetical protein
VVSRLLFRILSFLKQKVFKMNLRIKFDIQVLRNKQSHFWDRSSIIKLELRAECFHVIYILSQLHMWNLNYTSMVSSFKTCYQICVFITILLLTVDASATLLSADLCSLLLPTDVEAILLLRVLSLLHSPKDEPCSSSGVSCTVATLKKSRQGGKIGVPINSIIRY